MKESATATLPRGYWYRRLPVEVFRYLPEPVTRDAENGPCVGFIWEAGVILLLFVSSACGMLQRVGLWPGKWIG